MLTILDAVILIMLLFGAVIGFKKGVIKSAISFVGLLLVIILSFTLKDPISEFLYMHFPFISFGGILNGVSVINIIIYEVIAFFIVFSVLLILLKVLIFASGIIEKLLNLTIVLGLFSKILGLIFGFIEYYLIIFVMLFILSNVTSVSPIIQESSLANKILMNTPGLNNVIKDETLAVREILSLGEMYKNNSDEYNKNALEILLKYDIISPQSAQQLVEKGKLKINGANEIIQKYEGDKKW